MKHKFLRWNSTLNVVTSVEGTEGEFQFHTYHASVLLDSLEVDALGISLCKTEVESFFKQFQRVNLDMLPEFDNVTKNDNGLLQVLFQGISEIVSGNRAKLIHVELSEHPDTAISMGEILCVGKNKRLLDPLEYEMFVSELENPPEEEDGEKIKEE